MKSGAWVPDLSAMDFCWMRRKDWPENSNCQLLRIQIGGPLILTPSAAKPDTVGRVLRKSSLEKTDDSKDFKKDTDDECPAERPEKRPSLLVPKYRSPTGNPGQAGQDQPDL